MFMSNSKRLELRIGRQRVDEPVDMRFFCAEVRSQTQSATGTNQCQKNVRTACRKALSPARRLG